MRRQSWQVRPVLSTLLSALAGCAMLAAGLCLALPEFAGAQRYSKLSHSEHTHSMAARAGRNWEELRATNKDIAGWLRVENTAIDHPVVQAQGKAEEHYLTHDFWGEHSELGCLFLDARCNGDGAHALILGHHIEPSRLMFSELHSCYQQEAFNQLGSLVWETPTSGRTEFSALCARSEDMDWQEIQRFDFSTREELSSWLQSICSEASARNPQWEELAASATQVITLVTCSSPLAGQRWRTLVLFVS